MKKRILAVGVSAAAFLVPASPASAFYCGVADRPDFAGQVRWDKAKETNGGSVAPGAFDEGVMIRGGDHEHTHGTEFKSFGAATPQAIENGPSDHGVIEVE